MYKSLVTVAMATIAVTAKGVVIDFEELSNPGPDITAYGTLISKDFKFLSTPTSNGVFAWAQDSSFYSGSNAIHVGHGDWLAMDRVDDGLFSVESIGLADVFLGSQDYDVFVSGIKGDNTPVLEVIALSPASSMTSYSLSGFTDLKILYVQTSSGKRVQVDNIVTPVPEPGSLATLLVGASIALRRRKGHTS